MPDGCMFIIMSNQTVYMNFFLQVIQVQFFKHAYGKGYNALGGISQLDYNEPESDENCHKHDDQIQQQQPCKKHKIYMLVLKTPLAFQ